MDLRYSDTHEWVRKDSDEVVTVGLSLHAQKLLGNIVHIELPELGKIVNRADTVGVVESVKAASDYYAPVSGEIVAVNPLLKDNPALLNEQPESEGWLYQIKLQNNAEFDTLLSAGSYHQLTQG